MFVLGVTGPSGAGKSTVCDILVNRGFIHINTDRLVPLTYPDAIQDLTEAFGNEVISNGEVNKKELARIAFSSAENTEKLNAIIHPRVIRLIQMHLQDARDRGVSAAAVDGAALFEAGADQLCDRTICVLAPRELRLKRILRRDAISPEAALLRLAAQKDDDFYASRADVTLVNRNKKTLSREIEGYLKEWNV